MYGTWGESVANGEAKHSISNLVEGDMGLPMVGMQSSFQVWNPSILEVPWGTPWAWTHSHCSWLLVKNQTSHSSLGSEFQPLTDPQVIQRMRLNFPRDPKSPSQSNRFFWSPTMLPCCPMAEYLQYEFCITLRQWNGHLNGLSITDLGVSVKWCLYMELSRDPATCGLTSCKPALFTPSLTPRWAAVKIWTQLVESSW